METRGDGASNCRRTCQRVDPTASRMAGSRLRSLARAAKRLAKFAQAARSTKNASNMISRLERYGPDHRVTHPSDPRFTSLTLAIVIGILSRATTLRLSVASCGVTHGLSFPKIQYFALPARKESRSGRFLAIDNGHPKIRPYRQSCRQSLDQSRNGSAKSHSSTRYRALSWILALIRLKPCAPAWVARRGCQSDFRRPCKSSSDSWHDPC